MILLCREIWREFICIKRLRVAWWGRHVCRPADLPVALVLWRTWNFYASPVATPVGYESPMTSALHEHFHFFSFELKPFSWCKLILILYKLLRDFVKFRTWIPKILVLLESFGSSNDLIFEVVQSAKMVCFQINIEI